MAALLTPNFAYREATRLLLARMMPAWLRRVKKPLRIILELAILQFPAELQLLMYTSNHGLHFQEPFEYEIHPPLYE